MQASVRISSATPEADLDAAIQPGIATIYYPRVESARQVQAADEQITRLEKLRGMRPLTVAIRPLIESPQGVCCAREIAARSPRVHAFGLGPNVDLAGEARAYAQAECELVARVLGLVPLDLHYSFD
jgi:citrate lyase beta subunit